MKVAALALVAFTPIMIGPLPALAQAATLSAPLCNGGSVEIPVPGKAPALPEPCAMKACHAGTCRKKFDPAQCDGGDHAA